MNRKWIEKTETFLKRSFDAGHYLAAHPDAKAYRTEHSYRVANIGREIAAKEGFDETEMTIACLLHDLSYCEDFGEDGWKEHGRRSAALARPFLEELGLAEDRISEICYGIAIHVDDEADFEGERTPFALTVGDADNIDRLDVYRIHETLALDGFLDKSPEEKLAYAEERIARLRRWKEIPMATETAGKMWDERLSFAIAFYGKLAAQMKAGREIAGAGGSAALEAVRPEIGDLWFRRKMLADEETMSYNRAWGGTLPFPEEDWAGWYGWWVADPGDRRWYRYLKNGDGAFVGEIAYHWDEDEHAFLANVIVYAPYRGRGYGDRGLDLLCEAARENGVAVLYDDIAADNPAIALFQKHGFAEDRRTEGKIWLRKDLTDAGKNG